MSKQRPLSRTLFRVLLLLVLAMGPNPARGDELDDDLEDFNRLLAEQYCGGECSNAELALIAGYALSQEIRHANESKGQKARWTALAQRVKGDLRERAERFEELSEKDREAWSAWQHRLGRPDWAKVTDRKKQCPDLEWSSAQDTVRCAYVGETQAQFLDAVEGDHNDLAAKLTGVAADRASSFLEQFDRDRRAADRAGPDLPCMCGTWWDEPEMVVDCAADGTILVKRAESRSTKEILEKIYSDYRDWPSGFEPLPRREGRGSHVSLEFKKKGGSVDPSLTIELSRAHGASFNDVIASLNEHDGEYPTDILRQGLDFSKNAVLVKVPYGFDVTFIELPWKVQVEMRRHIEDQEQVIVGVARKVFAGLKLLVPEIDFRGVFDPSNPETIVLSTPTRAGSTPLSMRLTCTDTDGLMPAFSIDGGRHWENFRRPYLRQ